MECGLYRVRNVDGRIAMEWQPGCADFNKGKFVVFINLNHDRLA